MKNAASTLSSSARNPISCRLYTDTLMTPATGRNWVLGPGPCGVACRCPPPPAEGLGVCVCVGVTARPLRMGIWPWAPPHCACSAQLFPSPLALRLWRTTSQRGASLAIVQPPKGFSCHLSWATHKGGPLTSKQAWYRRCGFPSSCP